METADEETLLAHLNPPSQVVASEYARDGSVDIKKQPALKQSTGKWRACYFILGVEFCESMAYAAICTNLVTYLTTVLHERKVDAARNFSAWLGACFLSPLLGAFIADTYLGRYWTIVVSVPLYIIGMLVLIVSASLPVFSTSHGDGVHSSVVYLGLYLLAISNGGLKPCISTFGADQFDTNDPVELAQKGSFFNWFLDKAAIAPSDNESMVQMSPWRVCTVTQVEELKMLLSMSPIWGSFVIFYAVATQMQSTLVEQGMFMDNHVGSFAIPPASMPIVSVCSFLIWVPIYETILIPFARRFTGKEKGFSQSQRLGIGQALSTLTMVLAAMLETRRLAIAEANGLRDQDVPVPISILWQGPLYLVHGASAVFGGIGLTEFFYDEAPVTMRSLCAALGQLATAAGSYFSSAILSIVAVATTRDGAPGWIPDNLNEGHLDYFFWMMATLSLLNFALFVGYSMRPKGREYF
nr:unnamed protein product [Digitaria exilis]